MNSKYFKVVGIARDGVVENAKHGTLNLGELSDQKALQLVREGFPYIKLTKAGERQFNMDVDVSDENYAMPAEHTPADAPPEMSPEEAEATEQKPRMTAKEVVSHIKEAGGPAEARGMAEGYTGYKSVRDALDKKLEEFEA